MNKSFLVTGGLGYIGSHAAIELLNLNYSIFILDNLSNSNVSTLKNIKKITGKSVNFQIGDIRDVSLLNEIFKKNKFDGIFHFAGLKSIEESERNCLSYYANNVLGSLILFEEAIKYGIKYLIFSSSATVYGKNLSSVYKENSDLKPFNVYGKTKKIIEDFLIDLKKNKPFLNIAILRYFNPLGAHKSGLIGEALLNNSTNLMPNICQVAAGFKSKLLIFGNNYDTHDGTAMRDYIHITDLIKGHLSALQYLLCNSDNSEILILNLGTGKPLSVLEIVKAFEKTTSINIPYEFVPNRPGDLPSYYADSRLARIKLNWRAEKDIYMMCEDSWRLQNTKQNLLR